LSGANLSSANLSITCLDPNIVHKWRKFYKLNPPQKTGGHIVYRTCQSQHIGNTIYEPGRTYIAPALSWDTTTDCHPGIYAFATVEELLKEYPDEIQFLVGYIRRGEFTITLKGNCIIRCARYRALKTVSRKEMEEVANA
jgi:hypothetical protein